MAIEKLGNLPADLLQIRVVTLLSSSDNFQYDLSNIFGLKSPANDNFLQKYFRSHRQNTEHFDRKAELQK